jgi:hypothetical protein
MFNKITTGLLLTALSLALTPQTHAAVFRDVLEYGNNASMIGIGKIEGYTPHAGVLFENSAALTQADTGLSLFYLNAMDDSVTAITGAISHHLSPHMTVGFGVARESSGSLDFTGEENDMAVSLETFEYTNTAYIAGLGVNLTEMLNVGATYTHYDKQLYTVRGQGGAFGLSAHLDFNDTDLFLKAKNLGNNPIQYNEGDDENLLAEYAISLGHSFTFSESLSTTLMGQVKLSDGLPSLRNLGLRIHPFEKTLALGLGYQESRGLGDQVYGGFTLGLDLTLSNITFSYAYQTTQYVAKDHEHHFSVFFGF